MGQKINPYGFRLGITTDWKSKWFASKKQYRQYLTEDWKIRGYLMARLADAAVSRVDIERTLDKLRVDIHTARPGVVIGKAGAKAHELREHLARAHRNGSIVRAVEAHVTNPHAADRAADSPFVYNYHPVEPFVLGTVTRLAGDDVEAGAARGRSRRRRRHRVPA